ncbi:hypothetical protein Tco_0489568 [Tanacetum coccineum]
MTVARARETVVRCTTQAEQSDWLADTDEEIVEQELEAHYSYMAKIQEVSNADSGTDSEPLEQVKHSNDRLHLRSLSAQDMEILIKTCLMPLALKTQNDSFAFVHELKQEMHADLKECDYLAQKLSEHNLNLTKKPNVVPISTRKPKSQANKSVATPHKKTAASESTTTNSKSYYRMLYKKTSKAWKVGIGG